MQIIMIVFLLFSESRQIEKSGGYLFTTQTVPSTFNFGGQPIA